MTLDARLKKVMPALTGKQRAVMVLRANAAGEEVGALLRDNQPSESEQRAFRRYMGLVYVINRQLGSVCNVILSRAQSLESASYHYRLLNDGAFLLEKEHSLKRRKPVPDWRTRKNVEVNTFLRSVAEELRLESLDDMRLRWHEFRALEAVWEELAEEFDGVDPVEPEVRDKANELREMPEGLAVTFGCRDCLTEPEEAMLDQWRSFAKRCFDQLGLAGVYE
jgi:hypothetical protein